jgi:DNA anti-recombination protein RmuC
MKQLAQGTARTPLSEGDPPFEYVDRSLTILGRTLDTHDERIRQEFLGQHNFIASQFREVDRRFEEVEKKMDRRFEEMDEQLKDVNKKMDERFKETDKKIEEMNKKMREYLNHTQNTSRNTLRTRGWKAIPPVRLFDPQGEIHFPEYFPRTVEHF